MAWTSASDMAYSALISPQWCSLLPPPAQGCTPAAAEGLLVTRGKRSESARPSATECSTNQGVSLERANEVAVTVTVTVKVKVKVKEIY